MEMKMEKISGETNLVVYISSFKMYITFDSEGSLPEVTQQIHQPCANINELVCLLVIALFITAKGQH